MLDELRGRVKTALANEALADVLEEIEADVAERFGALEFDEDGEIQPVTETIDASGLSVLRLKQRPQSIVSLTDRHGYSNLALHASYFRIAGSRLIRNLGAWGLVTVEYIPQDTLAARRRIVVELVKAHLNNAPAIEQATIGPVNQMYTSDYRAEREKIFATYEAGAGAWFA
jgi:hypothetical protein